MEGDGVRVEQRVQDGREGGGKMEDDLKEAERGGVETEVSVGHDRTLLLKLGEEVDRLTPEHEVTSDASEEAGAGVVPKQTGGARGGATEGGCADRSERRVVAVAGGGERWPLMGLTAGAGQAG
ncbi:hypothetical protein B1218_33995 [Pseudomonas ogarae]|nr:hypothetical protein B1218_33995 [Pseudomonas ogarae]